MTRSITSVFATLIIIGLAMASFTVPKGVLLRFHPQSGKTYVVNTKASQTTVAKIQGQSMSSSQTVDTRQSFNVESISGQDYTLSTKIEAVKLKASQMGMTLNYDSENPQNTSPLLADQTKDIDELINNPISLKYNELGQSDNSEDIEMNQLGMAIIELPEEELSVGSQWTLTKSQEVSDVEFSINMTYTVTGINKKEVNVSFTGTIDSNEISGTYEGTSTISQKTGIVMSSSIKNNISMTISEQGFTIPVTISGTNTVSVEEK